MKRIPGAKSAMGAAEQIISMMPSHLIYVEGFGGSAQPTADIRARIYRRRSPATMRARIRSDCEGLRDDFRLCRIPL